MIHIGKFRIGWGDRPKPTTGKELLKLEFTRACDGAKGELECYGCARCKNYFFATLPRLEFPTFCPFCGIRFNKVEIISSDDMKAIQADL
jgi:hypothetical protein